MIELEMCIVKSVRDGYETDNAGFEVDEDRARDVFAGAGLREERVERVVAAADRLVARHLAVGLDPVLQAVQLPTGIPDLHSRLPHVHADTLALHQANRSHKDNKLPLIEQ